jgi:hypothetical protein
MLRTISLALCLALGLVALACSKTETTTNTNTTSGTTEKPAAPNTPATTTASTSGDSIGVPECDDFIAKYDACVSNKVPEMVRAQYKDAIARWRTEWKKLASDPATKGQLTTVCKQSLEQAKSSLNAFNCSW